MQRHRVVILGSGFGGLFAAKALKGADVDVTLIARTTHHLFQPLLYQVATGVLSEGEIAPATREILRKQSNAEVLLGLVEDIDLNSRVVKWRFHDRYHETPYDSLIVAAGADQSCFGNDHFAEFAPGMKTIDDALELRGRIYSAFEMAEFTTDPIELERFLTFVVVGAGPTGVEMAGQIRELASSTLRNEFRSIDPTTARVILIDGADQVLPPFGPELGASTKRTLERLGVEVQLGTLVTDVDATGLVVRRKDGTQERIEASTIVWAAGVQGNELGKTLTDQSGAELDRAGRVVVDDHLSLPGHPEVFVVGDLMSVPGFRAWRRAPSRAPGTRPPSSAPLSSTRPNQRRSSTATRGRWQRSPSLRLSRRSAISSSRASSRGRRGCSSTSSTSRASSSA